jgi:hypothetical protein
MNTRKMFFALAFVFGSIITQPAARAGELDQASKMTFSQAVQIPGHVLPAGTYWFVLSDIEPSRNVLQIFSADRSVIYATIITIPTELPQLSEKPLMTLAQRGTMQPEAIVSWVYPGRKSGHQFIYSKPEEQELARDKYQTMITG